MILSSSSYHEFQVTRPNDDDISVVESRTKYGDIIFKHPMISGYEGWFGTGNLRKGSQKPAG